MKHYAIWTLMFVCVQAVITAIQFAFRNKQIKNSIRKIITAAKALAAVAFAALVMGGPVVFRPVQPIMVSIYIVLFTDAAADIVYGMYRAVHKSERHFSVSKSLSFAFGVTFFIYGTVNMQAVRPNYHTYTSDKLTQEHKIVFLSDLHVGNSQNIGTTEKMIDSIRNEKPDAVILGGDITDDYTSKKDMLETYRLFGETGAPVYFIYGNHELVWHEEYLKNGLPYTRNELLQALQDNGIIVLCDEYAELAPDLLLLGREDAAEKELRKDIRSLPNPAPEKFLLVADHQPTFAEDNLAAGTDLQLSGHTHAGQLFPNGLFVSLVSYNLGDYSIGEGKTMLVSSGASGWRVPFRTESHCCYEVITLKPGE